MLGLRGKVWEASALAVAPRHSNPDSNLPVSFLYVEISCSSGHVRWTGLSATASTCSTFPSASTVTVRVIQCCIFSELLGSAAGFYLAVRWSYNKYPYPSYKHTHTIFEGEAAMAEENARIEVEARELVKQRPYGPWLFR